MSTTRTFLTILAMVAMTTTATLPAFSSAEAHVAGPIHNKKHAKNHAKLKKKYKKKANEAALLGALGGFVAGAIVSNAGQQQAPAPAAGLSAAHYAYCDAKYVSYVIATNTYTGYDGLQHYCYSPGY